MQSFSFRRTWCSLCLLAAMYTPQSALQAQNQDDPPSQGQRKGQGKQRTASLPVEIQAQQQLSVILARPATDRITMNLLAQEDQPVSVMYASGSAEPVRSASLQLKAGQPAELLISGLLPARTYHYRLCTPRNHDCADAEMKEETGFFRTAKAPGQSFMFALQGDSHPERAHQFDAALYVQTLQRAASAGPDFYLMMGDDFSVDTLHELNRATVTQRYQYQRPFLGLIGRSAPLFLVNGNHEQAAAANLNGSAENVAVWAQNARNQYYSQPAPDAFYTGNKEPVPHIGLLRNYFAWHWGDALFVVIDPYWHSASVVDNKPGKHEKSGDKRGQRDLWDITLGDSQYQWLRQTLESSSATYKFIFSHHVLGTGRGGTEQAGLYEWGGKDKRGVSEFAQRRPGWALPLHQLFVKHKVTAFFQGHDHIFAHQELDGVVYQTVPEPADPDYKLYFADAYRSGKLLPNSGHVRVYVAPDKVRVEYLRSYLPKDVSPERTDGEVAYSYEIPARR